MWNVPTRQRTALLCFCKAPRVLRDPRFDQLANQRHRQRLIRRKTDGTRAGVVGLQRGLVRGHRKGAWIKGAVLRGCAKGYQHSSIQSESGNLVTDAFRRLRRCRLDGPAKFLQRGALVCAQSGEILVDGVGFGCHGARRL